MIYSIQDNEDLQRANSLFDKINESSSNKQSQASKVEFVKQNGDITFGVIKEHGLYTVKASRSKNSKIIAEDFDYIKGFQQRKSFQRGSLQEAIKLLHLYINEEKYVVDVPLPDNYGQEAPVENVPQVPEMPLDQQPADGGADMPVDGTEAPVDGVEGAVDGGTDEQKEMQQLTGTLAQDLRTEIEKDNAQFTVGMFKSIIAAAKGLPQEEKQEVLNKAQEVLGTDENAEQGQEQAPAPEQQAAPMPANESVVTEGRLTDEDKADIDMANARFVEKLKAHPSNRNPKNARQIDFKPEEGQESAEVVVQRMVSDFGDLHYCDDYKEMVHKEKGAVRFITGEGATADGKYDLFIFYWSSVKDKNYDVYSVAKSDVAKFVEFSNHLEAEQIAKASRLDLDYDEVKSIATDFLSNEKKIMAGNLSVSAATKAAQGLLHKHENPDELDESVQKKKLNGI